MYFLKKIKQKQKQKQKGPAICKFFILSSSRMERRDLRRPEKPIFSKVKSTLNKYFLSYKLTLNHIFTCSLVVSIVCVILTF